MDQCAVQFISFRIQPALAMDILFNDYLNILFSLKNLAFYLMELLKQTHWRTLVIYYEGQTSFIATYILLAMQHLPNYSNSSVWLMYNLDENFPSVELNSTEIQTGNDLLTITFIDSIANGTETLVNFFNTFSIDPRFDHIFVVTKLVDEPQIVEFFEFIWKKLILNAALVCWSDRIRIYTHRPYEKRFLMPIFETDMKDNGTPLPHNLFDIIFKHNADNLNDTAFKVFVMEDPPKVFRIPARLRIGHDFYFGGRDGRVAREAERLLHARWKYRAPLANFRLYEFDELNTTAEDVWGNRVPSDLEQQREVEFPDASQGKSLT